jgi:hypothetical protein
VVLRPKEQCEAVKYRSSLQNFLINDGKEVILSDTGLPDESPDIAKKKVPLCELAIKWPRSKTH